MYQVHAHNVFVLLLYFICSFVPSSHAQIDYAVDLNALSGVYGTVNLPPLALGGDLTVDIQFLQTTLSVAGGLYEFGTSGSQDYFAVGIDSVRRVVVSVGNKTATSANVTGLIDSTIWRSSKQFENRKILRK